MKTGGGGKGGGGGAEQITCIRIIDNYSPKWRRLVVDIYQAAERQGK